MKFVFFCSLGNFNFFFFPSLAFFSVLMLDVKVYTTDFSFSIWTFTSKRPVYFPLCRFLFSWCFTCFVWHVYFSTCLFFHIRKAVFISIIHCQLSSFLRNLYWWHFKTWSFTDKKKTCIFSIIIFMRYLKDITLKNNKTVGTSSKPVNGATFDIRYHHSPSHCITTIPSTHKPF